MTKNEKDVSGASPKKYRGQSSDERVAERRQRLIETGIALYGSAGFRATSVKAICQAAGLTERYFYESFANGEALLCATCTVIMDGLRQQALEAMGKVGDSISERSLAAAQSYFTALQKYPSAGRVILFEMEGVCAEVDAHYANELAKSTQLCVDWFLSSARKKRGAAIKAEVLAQGVIGALYQIAKNWMRSGFLLSGEAMARHMQLLIVASHSAYCGDSITR
jgi:AcrR family transcriptional regulator